MKIKKLLKSVDDLKEGSIPRNASKIRATDKMNKKSVDLYKHGKYWKDSEGEDYNLYDPAYLRKWNDIEVLETDPNYKPNRTKPEYVVQGNYGYGWEDLTASDNPLEAKADLKAYRENELGVAHRLITRRVPVNESKALKENSDVYYVTVYEETSHSGPEEGGYTSYGWEATHSKKFNTLDSARKYLNDFVDGAEVIYNSGDTMEIIDEYGDTYKIRVETEEDRGSSNSPAKSWAQAEMGVEFDRPFFDDEGKRLPEDPKVTAKRKADREALKQEYIDRVNACQTKNDVIKLLSDVKYDSLDDIPDYVAMAMDKYKELKESTELSNEHAVESIVDSIKKIYELGGFKYLPVGRKNAAMIDISGPDKERLAAYFEKQPEFNYEMNNDHGLVTHEFISDKYDVEIYDSFISMYKIPQNESLSESIDVDTIADYITDHYDFDDVADKYACINSIRDSHKDTISQEELEQFIGSHNGKDKVEEGYEFSPKMVDITWRPYDNEKGQVMADKWYASKWPDDEVGIEQLQGITLDDALKDRSILDHCDTQVRERVYAQLDKYIPLSKESPMYKEVNEDYSDLNKGEWVEYNLSVRKGTENIIPVKVDIDLGNEFYGWAWGEGYHKYQKSRIVNKIDMDDTDEIIRKYSLNEASYGGAFDIADDQYFTRDDLLYFADEVLGNVAETFEGTFDIGGVWFEDGCVVTQIVDDEGNMFEDTTRVDMRKVKEPWHLRKAYGSQVSANIIKQIKELYGMDESVVSSSHEFDDVDDLSYYYEDEEFRRALEEEPYNEIASKQVPDVSGFLTDYTMYQNMNTGEYVFVFGDKDIYKPEDGNFDWECETEEEAKEWFDNYVGFDDDLVDECWSSKLEEETETSPIVHKKSDGSYLVQSDSGDGYTAFNKDNVCQGHISASNETEAKNKFNSNKFDE